MFRLRKKQDATAVPQPTYVAREGAKNRPTPKRRDQEAARKRPLVPTDRKAAARGARSSAAEARVRQREALLTGDEAHLPLRDRGPVRRYLRDTVDARFNVGEYLLPVMLLVLVASFVAQRLALGGLVLLVFVLVYALVIVGIVDGLLTWRRARKKAAARFGEDAIPRGAALYTVMRCFQLRRTRLPRPMVKRGQHPG